jgi:hypothetical protein
MAYGLDHDEYGVEHVVLDGRGGALMSVYHVYVYPDGEVDGFRAAGPWWQAFGVTYPFSGPRRAHAHLASTKRVTPATA